MSHTIIRRATPHDAAALAKLSETVHEMHTKTRPEIFKPVADNAAIYSEAIEQKDSHIFIAQQGDEAVGYVIAKILHKPESALTKASQCVHVDEFCVAPSHQNHGHGSALMEAVYNLAREQNIRRITLDVWAFNTQALQFYEKRGFAPFMQRLETHLD